MFPVVLSVLRSCNDAALQEESAMVLANPWSGSVGITLEVGEKLLQEKVPQVRSCFKASKEFPRAPNCAPGTQLL